MQDAQFVFVTEDARVMAMLADGSLEDVTETADLLQKRTAKSRDEELAEKKRALLLKFAA